MDTRTNIVLDDALVNLAMVRARVKTKKAAIEAALRAFVKKPDYAGLMALRGKGMLAADYDPSEAFSAKGFGGLVLESPRAEYKVAPQDGKAQNTPKPEVKKTPPARPTKPAAKA